MSYYQIMVWLGDLKLQQLIVIKQHYHFVTLPNEIDSPPPGFFLRRNVWPGLQYKTVINANIT